MPSSDETQDEVASKVEPATSAPRAVSAMGPPGTTELLSRLWLQNLPLLRHRIDSLEAAAAQALAGELPVEIRTGASDIAHKLAGSLGMFGYPAGTDVARQMEFLLETDGPVDPSLFVQLVAELRRALPL